MPADAEVGERRTSWVTIVLVAVAALAVGALIGYARGTPMDGGLRTDVPESVTIVVDRD